MKTLLRFFFRLLYHEFAFTYDLVAATVSFNRWKDWVMSALPFIEGKRVLEIGHGPGHLQRALLSRGLVVVGIDESAQMGRFAQRNLRRGASSRSQDLSSLASSASLPTAPSSSSVSRIPQFAYTQISLTRGLAQQLPFPDATFDTVVSTFPAEYIFDPKTLLEAHRVLTQAGRFLILPGAVIVGRGAIDRLLAWVFRITGETPPNLSEIIHERSKEPFAKAGFHVEVHEVTVRSSLVFIMLATKIQIPENLQYA